jgi:hypothetical protein
MKVDRLGLVMAVALIVSACGTATVSPVASTGPSSATASPTPATASPTPVATVSPVPSPSTRPTASPTLSPSAVAARHVTGSIKELLNLVGNDAIKDWLNREEAWLKVSPNLPILRSYNVAMANAFIDVAFTPDANLAIHVPKLVAAAQEIPGVVIP